jgi:hypothetical protein
MGKRSTSSLDQPLWHTSGRVHAAGLKIYDATLSSPKGDPSGGYGTPEGLANRLVINAFIRTSGLFDGVEDFDAATYDPATGGIRTKQHYRRNHR